jgi:hypothetical protein
MRRGVTMQVHPSRVIHFDKQRICACLKETGADVQVQEGAPKDDYINFNCWTAGKVSPIWQCIQRLFAEQADLRTATIVCCTGNCGWDDYRLLHGAVEGEQLDVLGDHE